METKGLFMIGAVLVGGYLVIGALKDMDAAAPSGSGGLVSLSSRGLGHAEQTRAEGAAESYIVARNWGEVAEGPIANHDGSRAVFIGDAIPDWRPADADEVADTIQLLNIARGCTMPAPAAGARVVNLMVEHPETKAGLWSYDEADLLKGVRKWFRNIRGHEDARLPGPMASHEFRVHDIAITETDQPVHLVLQNLAAGNILYNLHLAPGARVSGVSMLGGAANAVANIAPGVPVAAMDRATLRGCGAAQARTVRLEADIAKRLRDHQLRESEVEAGRAEAAARVSAFNDWFDAQFGIRSEDTLVGMSYAEVSLIGPVPDDPSKDGPRYAPLAGAYVVAQTEQYFKAAGRHDWPDAYQADVVATATQLAGGDPREVVKPKYSWRAY